MIRNNRTANMRAFAQDGTGQSRSIVILRQERQPVVSGEVHESPQYTHGAA